MSKIIGIDLGTTFSATGIVHEGKPTIIPQGDERIMPSVVGLAPQGALLVGRAAQNQYVVYPEKTIRSIKRKMGQDVQVPLGDTSHTPPEISAMILRELKRNVEQQLGESVERAVITVPAYFSDKARQATHEAGEIAGFTVERIINEPTAAALAYGLNQTDERQIIAVYDLGGGTFDVSIIEMDAGVVEVRASHGNTQLGGDDFDERLVNYLAEQFMDEHNVDPRENRQALARLNRAAEAAKITLSSQPFVQVREEYLVTQDGHPLHLDIEVSRTQFESLIEDLLEGTLQSLDAALKDAEITAQDLHRILFVGGSTRIPIVWQMVTDHTGLEPDTTINPDEAVALGAATQAAIIAGEPIDAILVDVTPHSLGIQVADLQFGRVVPDRYSIIIHRNTTIPTSRSEVYSAIYPEQSAIEIKVYQGEHPIASRNTLLGEFMFDQLKPEAPGLPPRITVQFDFDVNGMLNVSAVDRGSGKQAHKTVKAGKAHLSPSEIASARAELEEMETVSNNGSRAPWEMEETISEADLEVQALIERAKELIAAGKGDTIALKATVTKLIDALEKDDQEEIAACSDDLLDLLYDVEDEDDEDDVKG